MSMVDMAADSAERLGVVVQTARQKAGLTQQALCQKSGLSYSTLAKIERGAIKSPSIFTIQHIAATLGIGLDQLMQPVQSVPPVRSRKKVSRSGVRFVYLDLNGVLVRPTITKAANLLAEQSGVTPDVIETIFWSHNSEICRGSTPVSTLNELLSVRTGQPVDWINCYMQAVEAMPGMRELTAWISENYHLGILTNTMPGLVRPLIEQNIIPDLPYDVIIDSFEVGLLKPEAAMFELATEKSGVTPEQILLVDDDQQNIAAAARAGWNVTVFNSYEPEQSIVSLSTALQPIDS